MIPLPTLAAIAAAFRRAAAARLANFDLAIALLRDESLKNLPFLPAAPMAHLATLAWPAWRCSSRASSVRRAGATICCG